MASLALRGALRTRLFGCWVEIRTGFFVGGNLVFWRVWRGGEWREDSETVNESFWDAPGVEIEAKQDLGFWART